MESSNIIQIAAKGEKIEISNQHDELNKSNGQNNSSQNKNENFPTPCTTPLNDENMFGIKDDDLDRILYNFSVYISDINLRTIEKTSDLLETFYKVEKKLTKYLNSLDFLKFSQLRLLHLLTDEMLTQKFQDKENIFKGNILAYLDSSYQNLINSDIKKEDYSPYFEFLNKSDEQDLTVNSIKETFKEIIYMKMALYISSLESVFKTDQIPHFLIKNYKKKIKQKIKLICNPLVKEHYHSILENKIEVKVLKGFIQLYSNNSLNLFDFQFLTKKIVENLLEIFILSNIEYLKNDPLAMSTLISNLPKYINIMKIRQLNEHDEELKIKEEFFINKKVDEIITKYFDLPLSEREDMIRLHVDILKSSIGDYNEKYFFVIFSFSLMLNNIIKLERSSVNRSDVVLNDNLVCNSRERQFLSNLLKSLQNYFDSHYDPFTINSYTQSIVITNILKSKSVEMFDKDLILKEEKINIEKIQNFILEGGSGDHQNSISNSNNINNNFYSTLSEEFLNEFISLLNQNKTVSFKADPQQSRVKSYLKSIFNTIYNYTYPDERVDLTSYNIVPFDSFTLSTNACICISGFTSEGTDQERAWENMTVDLNKYIDFYFLNWPSESAYSFLKDILYFVGSTALSVLREDYISVITNVHSYTRTSNAFLRAKKAAKVCGKLLAHILASRAIFKFQTFNLVGFSLGAHLIKHCLKELYRLGELNDTNISNNINSIIQNVVFVAGATSFKQKDKWQTIFKNLVAGRVINCHGKNDNILKFMFRLTTSNVAIGQSVLNLGNEKENYKIHNFDFSDLGIDHYEYRKSLNEILKRIKLN
jgi:hypothetical protein